MKRALGPTHLGARLSGDARTDGGQDETVSVIICVYTEERWAIMREAIASVRNQTRPADEIVVVVDHNDALADRLERSEYGIRIERSRGTKGLSGARNHGVQGTSGTIVAFLDDDAVADPDWLEQLLPAYADRDVAGVGGLIRPRWTGQRPRFFPHEFDWVVGCSYRGMPETRQTVRNLIGANMSFRRTVFERAGFFSSDLGRVGSIPLGCEETELCIRYAQLEQRSTFVYEPRAGVDHLVPSARQLPGYFYRRCYGEGLSKAAVVAQSAAREGLSSEAAHVARALPRGVAKGMRTAFADRKIDGAAQAGTILAGLAVTTAGYVVGTTRRIWHRPTERAAHAPTTHQPVRIH